MGADTTHRWARGTGHCRGLGWRHQQSRTQPPSDTASAEHAADAATTTAVVVLKRDVLRCPPWVTVPAGFTRRA